MHEHDFDLMAALADGTASPTEAVAAERARADCDECAAEYRSQLEVLEFLRSTPPVSMTDMERAALHRTLRQAAPSPRVGWFTRYAPRIAAVAAGFAVVGLASVAMLDRTANEAVSDTAALRTATDSADDGGADIPMLEAPAEESAEMAEAPAADDSDFATGVADEAASEAPAPLLREITGDDLKTFQSDLTPEEIDTFEGLASETATRCSDQLPSLLQPQAAAEVLFEGAPAIVLVYTSGGETITTALATDDCEVLAEFVTGP